jgi:hypothetical protein
MGFLNPLSLLLAGAVAIPLLLHLHRRYESPRLAFPALRYLQRAEQDHARTIRLRQLLLLVLRALAVLLLALAAARPFMRTGQGDHEPTALVIVLDNSLSSGLIDGERRILDDLKDLAQRSVRQASPSDRIWVIRAGEPWDVSIPGDQAEAVLRIRETLVSDGGAQIPQILLRAISLIRGSDLPAGEIHLFSDLQASSFGQHADGPLPSDIPVVISAPRPGPSANRYLEELVIGGGLPPLAGQRTELGVRLAGTSRPGDGAVSIRLTVGERLQGTTSASPGNAVLFPMGPFSGGIVTGHVEADPDELRADDRRHFALRTRPSPGVALSGRSFFLAEAMSVLEDEGRARRVSPGDADIVFSDGGVELEERASGVPVVIVPPPDRTRLPEVNRRLAREAIPWRLVAREARGEARIQDNRLHRGLPNLRVFDYLELRPTDEATSRAEVWVRLGTGLPWMVTGEGRRGGYLLVASPLDAGATNIPVSAAMIPLVEWMLGHWAAPGPGSRPPVAGNPIPVPTSATGVVDPDGTVHSVVGSQPFRATRKAGIYRIMEGDSVVSAVAVNTPLQESILDPMPVEELRSQVGEGLVVVDGPARWEREIFRDRRGSELWRLLVLTALFLLVAESWIASAGAGQPAEGRTGADRGRQQQVS